MSPEGLNNKKIIKVTIKNLKINDSIPKGP